MSRTGLNLGLLRGRTRADADGPDSAAQGTSGLSRRQLFRIAGAVAVAAKLMPVTRAMASSNTVQFTSKPGRAAFKLDGQEAWVVDTKAFGGAPRLSVTQGQDSVHLVLTGATFPGTELPADMVCDAQLIENGSIQISFTVGRFTVKAPLAKWLAGDAPAVSRAALDHLVCTLGDQGRLTLDGTAKAQFFPDWGLKLDGTAIARVTGVGRQELVSDSVSIALLTANDPSLLSNAAARRTLISLGRRDRNWDLGADALAPEGWRLEATDHPFDTLHIETSLSQKGEIRRAMAAEAGSDDSRLALVAAAGLKGTDGEAFSMPLTSVRFAQTFDPNGNQVALVGRFGKDPVWLHADGCSMLLGDSPGAPALELVQKAGQITKAACTPALLGMSSPIPNAVVEPQFGSSLTTVSLTNLVPRSTALIPSASDTSPLDRIPPVFRPPVVAAPGNLKLSIVRPEDLLVLSFEFVNLSLQAGGDASARLVRQTANRPAYIVVTFQPQSIGERAYFETETPGSPGDETPAAPPVPARLAGPSRLAFRLPPDMNHVPYTLDALLSWTNYDHALVATALPPALLLPVRQKPELLRYSYLDIQQDCNCEPLTPALITPPRIQMADAYTTSIEAPYRVHISPNKFAGWAHSIMPVTHDGRTELWHTRLGVRNGDGSVDEQSAYYRTVRAIWSPDYSPAATPGSLADSSPFRMSLTSSWRDQIVRLSSDYLIKNFHPRPIAVERLMLSSLGAWMNVRGFWSTRPAGFTVEEWRHRAVMGRDTYVRVVEPGYLFPFGNKAALITVTERKFQPTPSGNLAAYLRQRKFIVVRQPEKTFPTQGQAYSGRNMPMKTTTITTLVTPALDLPQEIFPGKGEAAFWPMVGGKDFLFNVVSIDGEGQRQEFSTPMAFVREDLSDNALYMQTLADSMATGDISRRERDMKGQKVAFAPATKPGDTSFACKTFTFAGEVPDASVALPTDQPRFFPAMAEAQVQMAHVEALTGSNAGAKIKMAQAFLDSAFDTAANKTSIFAELVDAVSAKFPANMSGGVATPDLDVTGLSKSLGPVGGPLSDLVGGQFDPKKFFSDEAKILGGIILADIIQALGLDGSNQNDPRVPQITSHVVYPEKNGQEDKDAVPLGVEIKLYWKPDVKNDPFNIFVTNSNTSLEVRARLYKTFDGADPQYQVQGELKNFDVDLIAPISSFLYLTFRQVTFEAKNGSKPSVDPKIEKVDFRGPLAFVKTLQEFLSKASGGDSPFSLDIQPTGVTAGLTVQLPNITVGIMSLTNMALSAQLCLPFTGDPVRVRFAFCSRENPFCLTVSLFGGGGFFGINLGLDGIELLEASFEFGGNFSLDIGVASGGVHVMAGIYYKMEKNQNGKEDCSLTGYLRLGGSVEVLGIITISVEFNMSLTYDITNDKVWGQATLTVKIEILFFSVSADLHVERKFKGSNGDPTFADLMDRSDWESYTEAFA